MKKLIFMNKKGISVLFLIVAMLLMVTIGYVLSYLIPTKQKSVKFPIYSTQAFFIAQSGMEYGVRYCSDQGWRGATESPSGSLDYDRLNDPLVNQRNIVIGKVDGKFTINYNTATNLLTSTGEINNASEKRIIRVSNFTGFLRLIFNPASSAPCWSLGTRRARFFIKNVRGNNVVLTAFSASWTQTGTTRRIRRIDMAGSQKYAGNYSSGSGRVNFNRGGSSQTIASDQVISVLIYWRANISNGANVIVTFYTTTGDGSTLGYTFNLDSAGNGLPSC